MPLRAMLSLLLRGACVALVVSACGDADEPGGVVADAAPDAAACGPGGCDAACAEGALGCACAPSGACAPGLTCGRDSRVCEVPVGCMAGSGGCVCREPGRACDAPWVCGADDTCVPPPCLAGDLGCPCDPSGACRGSLVCAAGVCQEDGCPAGSRDCACLPGDACDPAPIRGSRALTCLPEADGRRCRARLVVPEDPPCYSPCAESIVDDQGVVVRRCDRQEALMAGCLGTTTCQRGQCLAEGESARVCNEDAECPEWQTCIQGGCYSTCEADADCDADATCFRKVCRTQCDTTNATCAPGQVCRLSAGNGAEGVCMPVAAPGAPSQGERGTLSVTPSVLEFTNVQPTGVARITNSSDRPQVVTVRKAQHITFSRDGQTTVHAEDGDAPMPWLALGDCTAEGAPEPARVASLELELAAGETKSLCVAGAFTADHDKWDGRLEIGNDALGYTSPPLTLSYTSRMDGQWSGSLFTFINFDDEKLEAWKAAPSLEAAQDTENAFLSRWTDFREGQASLDEFLAMARAVTQGTWRQASTKRLCAAANPTPGVACFLYDDPRNPEPESGVRILTDSTENVRVPSGVVEMPFAVNVASSPDDSKVLTGRIESRFALQYPGAPRLDMALGLDPTQCERPGSDICIVPVDQFDATMVVGGRFFPEGRDCSTVGGESYQANPTPWLLPDFAQGTRRDDNDVLVREECRESMFPVDSAGGANAAALNRLAAGANPIPDGRARARSIRLVDGVLVNGHTLLLIIEESYEGFSDAEGRFESISTYGFVVLQRSGVELAPSDFTTGVSPAMPPAPMGVLDVQCDPDLLESLGVGEVNAQNASTLATRLLTGVPPTAQGADALLPNPEYTPHWLCEATGRFDGGPQSWLNDAEGAEPCPVDSRVVYFAASAALGDVRANACQGERRCPRQGDCPEDLAGACGAVLNTWEREGRVILDPARACLDAQGNIDRNTIYCERDRADLFANQRLYSPVAGVPAFSSLLGSIDDAFRYKTRFRNPSGRSVGFVPAVCSPAADLNPYCFDPQEIERLRARMDCLISLGTAWRGDLTLAAKLAVDAALREQFSVYDYPPLARGEVRDAIPYNGFERNYAELLIMLGDEALTRAVGSRFDLAGAASGVFPGDVFEPDGLSLSAGPGYEMQRLYEAVQAYQLVLDRFGRISPTLWRVVAQPDGNFVTPDSVSTYFTRLVLASTNKAKAWSYIAQRYKAFNRPTLARRVIERAYIEAYLESVTLSQVMKRAIDKLRAGQADARSQLRSELDLAQTRYAVALNTMRTDYLKITDEQTFFGLAADYVPFPVLGRFDATAVSVLFGRAFATLRVAAEREDRAIESGREFDSDAAQFQAELARVRNQYEDDLARVCGTFVADEGGQVFPAIEKYAERNAAARNMGDPCGAFQSGDLYQAVGEVDDARFEVEAATIALRNLFAEADIERRSVQAECDGRVEIGQLAYEAEGEALTIDGAIDDANQEIARTEREMALIDRSIGVARDGVSAIGAVAGAGPLTAAAAGIAGAALTLMGGVAAGVQASNNRDMSAEEEEIQAFERQVGDVRRAADFDRALMGCCLDSRVGEDGTPVEPVDTATCENPGPTLVNSRARIDTLMVGLLNARLNLMKANLKVNSNIAAVRTLQQSARRLLDQQAEADQLLINVEAVRNDPNVRIYRNAAVLDADKSFDDALQDAYAATRVFEYYTNQSYARRDELFLARLAQRGEGNLENYMIDLRRAYRDFEEQNGLPELRLAVVSMMRDVLRVAETADPAQGGEPGTARSVNESAQSLRDLLTDPKRINARGNVVVPFSTTLAQVSPRTSLHKIDHIEVNIETSDSGDSLGRVYVNLRGTSTVRSGEDDKSFYRFPAMRAVVNPMFGGKKKDTFDPLIYQDSRFKDRPFANSAWELELDLRGELVNRDINLNDVTDIVLYVYYTDFSLAE